MMCVLGLSKEYTTKKTYSYLIKEILFYGAQLTFLKLKHALVVKLSSIIWSREYGNQSSFGKEVSIGNVIGQSSFQSKVENHREYCRVNG